ncbi:MAG: hypothetical protein OIF40_01285 [Mangrovicoccus sp.]|nr:hypothetical protein [Mangrovicoccus sp.]
MRKALGALLLWAPLAALAQEAPLSAEAFEAFTQGKTLVFSTNGIEFGAEEYLPGRKVRWAFLGQECMDGEWYPRGDLICFRYDQQAGEQCWHFFLKGGALTARARDPGDPGDLFTTRRSPEPLFCLGPEIGV